MLCTQQKWDLLQFSHLESIPPRNLMKYNRIFTKGRENKLLIKFKSVAFQQLQSEIYEISGRIMVLIDIDSVVMSPFEIFYWNYQILNMHFNVYKNDSGSTKMIRPRLSSTWVLLNRVLPLLQLRMYLRLVDIIII